VAELSIADALLRLLGGALGAAVLLPIAFVVNDWIGRTLARARLAAALRKEIEGAKAAVANMQRDITDTVPRAEKIVEDVKYGRLQFEDLHELFSGWVIYVPQYPLVETVTKMRSSDVGSLIRYFDLWNRVASYEKAYSAAHAKLVELSDQVAKQPVRCRETASQVRGCLKQLILSAEELQNAAEELESVISPETEKLITRIVMRMFA
jgi:hypothetical protein